MARYLSLYVKKRGDRRTGSRAVGSALATAISAVLFFAGCGWLIFNFAHWTLPELRANRDFVRHTCRIEGKRLEQKPPGDRAGFQPQFLVKYTVAGRKYRTWARHGISDVPTADRAACQKVLDGFHIGKEYACWYDPADHRRAVLTLGYSWFASLMLVVPATLMAIGGGGLFFGARGWGQSTERRAALADEARRHEIFQDPADRDPRFPNVPRDSLLTNSPGTALAFRLPSDVSNWPFVALLVACITWNAIVGALGYMAFRAHQMGSPDWFLSVFISLLGVMGLCLAQVVFRQFKERFGIGPTIVEISQHPLHPGDTYAVYVSQAGKLAVERVCVLLVCEEEAVYRQGTDTRTATRRVHEQSVWSSPGLTIRPGNPCEARCKVTIPAGAMHSFRAQHNGVNWKILVQLRAKGGMEINRSFPVHVYPRHGGSDTA